MITTIDLIFREENTKNVNLVTHTNCSDIILDTGASRHLHIYIATNTTSRPYNDTLSPQTLTGFMGKQVKISQSGTVGSFSDVFFMPTVSASARSVGYVLDRRGGSFAFDHEKAVYNSSSGTIHTIAKRNKVGL